MNNPPIEPVSPEDYLLVKLAMASNGKRSARQLAGDLKSRLAADHTLNALGALARDGLVTGERTVSLTAAGEEAVRQRFGNLRADRKRLETVCEPALALGIALDSKTASRLARPETLRAVLLTRVYALPLDESEVTLTKAVGALLRRGAAGLLPGKLDASVTAAADVLPDDLSDPSKLRAGIITLALSLGTAAQRSATTPSAAPADASKPSTPIARADTSDIASFASRVLDITRTAHTGPFAHKTPIAHVYNIYGRRHSDAGALDHFKQRLLDASNAGHIALLPLDDSTTMDAAMRERSEITTPTGHLHFVERDA